MGKGLKKYLVENSAGLLTLNFEKLEKLSNRKFRRIQLQENGSFIRNHVKQTGHFPECEYCEEHIAKPEELIREPGGSSHVWCFETIYKGELRKNFCENEQEYFDRLILTLLG